MRLPIPFFIPLCAALAAAFAGGAQAQGRSDFTLNDGQVSFRVPAGWVAVMEKTEGNPQAIAFQIASEATQGTEDSATAVVKTRVLRDTTFNDFVRDEKARAAEQGGYAKDGANKDNAAHQYFVVRGSTRYLIRDSYAERGNVAVEVRCQRPLLDALSAEWNARFDQGCISVASSLK